MKHTKLQRMEELGWEYIETYSDGLYRKGEHKEGGPEWQLDWEGLDEDISSL